MTSLQWGGRFAAAPDGALLAFGSSLNEDLILAPFDIRCSLAHVDALLGGGLLSEVEAAMLERALNAVSTEIAEGTFADLARNMQAEDIHGAIDQRVRELAGDVGERLHAGRSRNDQVATTLLLYVRDRASILLRQSLDLAAVFAARATVELEAETVLAGCTHRQPAQPVLLAFVLAAWAEPFVRAARRFSGVGRAAAQSCPLGSAALAGSTLPLDRTASAAALRFAAPSRNALDSIGNRDGALDLTYACVRTVIDASRIAEELTAWAMPAFGYVALGDAASTGSSLMPQKRNPDPFELVRAHASSLVGRQAGALATLCGLAPSYQRDLQETKAVTIAIVEQTVSVIDAFSRAFKAVTFDRESMRSKAGDGYTVATDIADALIAAGAPARVAHALVGEAVARAEAEERSLNADDLARLARERGLANIEAPLDPEASIRAKKTAGSTSPVQVRQQIASVEEDLAALLGEHT